MSVFLTILHIVFCFTLIGVILLQAGKGQGLTGPAFGGGNVQSLFGTQGADFLAKATTVAAICFLLTSIGLDYLEVKKSKSLFSGSMNSESTINVDTIKKAMEKIQSEATDSDKLNAIVEDAAQQAEQKVEEVSSDLTAKTEETIQTIKEEVDKPETINANIQEAIPAA